MKSQTDLLAVGILLAALFNCYGQNGSSESPGSHPRSVKYMRPSQKQIPISFS
jgi:hypothetical protein